MRIGEIMKRIMKERKISQGQVSAAIGKLQQSVSRSMKKDSAPMRFFVECCEAMGYEVVIQPKSAGKRKEGSFVVTVGEEGKGGKE